MTLDVFVDEFTHVWNNQPGIRGRFLSVFEAEDHVYLGNQAFEKGTEGLSTLNNIKFHQLELRNYLRSNAAKPDFWGNIPEGEFVGFWGVN